MTDIKFIVIQTLGGEVTGVRSVATCCHNDAIKMAFDVGRANDYKYIVIEGRLVLNELGEFD